MIINKNKKTIYAEDLLNLAEDIVVAEALGTAFDKQTEGGKSFSKLNRAASNDKFYELAKIVDKLTDNYYNYVDICAFLENVKKDNFPNSGYDDKSQMPISENNTLLYRKYDAYDRLFDMVNWNGLKKGLFCVDFSKTMANEEELMALFENKDLALLWRDAALMTYAIEANNASGKYTTPVMKDYEESMRRKLFGDIKRFDNGTPEYLLSLHFDLANANTCINECISNDFKIYENRYLPLFKNEECKDTSKRYFNLVLDNLKKTILAYGISKNRIILESENAYDELISKFGNKNATNFDDVTIVGKKHADVKALADVSRGKEVRDTDQEIEF